MEFKSQICTDINQSRKLLELGLKKETADCYWTKPFGDWIAIVGGGKIDEDNIPAWSLHRLMCMLPKYVRIETYKYGRKYMVTLDLTMDSYQNVCYLEGVDEPYYDKSFYANDAYESICKVIEWLIKEGYFNKDYLEDKK